MNSYGDPSSPRGRAQIPGSNGGSGSAPDDSYQPRDDGSGYPSAGGYSGSARPPRQGGSSGRASVGGAPVSPAPGSPA
ncbi:hypothetical protein ACFQ0D_11780, partial [Micromonospora zhanjiangensis]